ncbi:MAG: DUF4097 family beta strand repeat-containing protein [Vicinamibacterales bacterium]
MRSQIALLGLVLTAGLSLAACDIKTSANGDFSFDISGGKAQDTWTRSYTVSDKGRFELINVNGRITAEPATDGRVSVEGRRTAKGSSDEAAKENLAKLEIREEVSPERVRVESRPPRLSGFGGHEIEWTIKVPAGVVVDLRTVNGGVRLNGLEGEVHAKTTNGGVRGSVKASILEASSVNGGIEVELTGELDANATVDLETVNGGVEFSLPSSSKANISARAVNGGVQVTDLEVEKQAESSSFASKRRLEGTMNGGGARVNLSTVNGGVRLSRSGGTT